MSKDTHIITVTDREGDIFELFALERPRNMDLLIRAVQNRRVKADDSEDHFNKEGWRGLGSRA
jgi:hypothetical protein